jgi:hypothetical protein
VKGFFTRKKGGRKHAAQTVGQRNGNLAGEGQFEDPDISNSVPSVIIEHSLGIGVLLGSKFGEQQGQDIVGKMFDEHRGCANSLWQVEHPGTVTLGSPG